MARKAALSLYLSADQISQIRAAAKREGRSVSDWIGSRVSQQISGAARRAEDLLLAQNCRLLAATEEWLDRLPGSEQKSARDRITARSEKFISAAKRRLAQ
ncbi:MAG: hypothetical protein ACK5NN_11290 [Sphingomonadaceae bacterium]